MVAVGPLLAFLSAVPALSLADTGTPVGELSERSLLEVQDISGVSASPDGHYVAARAEAAQLDGDTYRLEWNILNLKSGAVVHRISGGEPMFDSGGGLEPGQGIWSKDSRSFIFRVSDQGRVGLRRINLLTEQVGNLVDGAADVGIFAPGTEDNIIFQVGAPRADVAAAEQREFRNGTRIDKTIAVGRSFVGDVPKNGNRRSLRLGDNWTVDDHGLIYPEPVQTRSISLDTGAERAASPTEEKLLEASPSILSPNGRRALVTQVASSHRYVQLRRFELPTFRIGWSETGKPDQVCQAPECGGKVSPIAWSSDQAALYFRRDEPLGMKGLYSLSTQTGEVRTILRTSETLGVSRYQQGGCPVAEGQMICVVASAASPPQLVRISLDSGIRKLLMEPNKALRNSINAEVERLVWRSSLGDETYGYLLRPPGVRKGKYPLVITQYSCDGFLRGGTGDEFPELLFAHEGIAAVCAQDFWVDNPRKGLRHPEQQSIWESLKALVGVLGTREDIDIERLGIAGFSSGADKTLYAISHSNAFKAAAVGGPTVDPILSFIAGIPENRLLDYMPLYGVPPYYLPNNMSEDDKVRWNELSPALRASHIRTPLLMQLADSEVTMAMQLYSALTALRRPVDAYVYADELHVKRHPSHRFQMYQRNVDWFCYWLQERRREDREDGRFKHWDALPRTGSDAPDMKYLLGPNSGSLRTLEHFQMRLPE